MKETTVVNIKHTNDYDVYIGRSGKGQNGYFGNPFKNLSRSESIKAFKDYAIERINDDPEFRENVKNLYGKTLGCFCKPKACHGDILVKLAEQLHFEDIIFKDD